MWNVAVVAEQPVGPPVSVKVEMRLRASADADSGGGSGVLSIPSISGDAASATPVAFDLELRDGVFTVGKAPGLLPIDLGLSYRLDDGAMEAGLNSRGFRAGDFVSLSGGLEAFGGFLDISVLGTASLRRDGAGGLRYDVDLSGSSLGSRSFAPTGEAMLELDLSGDGNGMLVRSARFLVPETGLPGERFFGSMAFEGSVALNPPAPDGTLSVKGFAVAGLGEMNGEIGIRSSPDAISLRADSMRIGDSGRVGVGATVRPGADGTGFEVSLLWPGQSGERGSASLRGTLSDGPRRVEAGLSLRSFPLRAVAEATASGDRALPVSLGAILGLQQGAVVSADVSFESDFSGLSFDAPNVVFSGRDFDGTLSVSGTENGIDLAGSLIAVGGETLLLSGSAEFPVSGASRGGTGFSVNAVYGDIGYFVGGTVGADFVAIRGSNGLEVNLSSASGGRRSGRAVADGFPLPFLGRPALLSLNANLEVDGSGRWSFGLDRLEIADISGPAGIARLLVSGGVSEGGAVFPILFYEDAVGPLSGSAEVSWGGGVDWNFSVGSGAENYVSRGSLEGGSLAMDVSGSSMRLYRFARALRNTTADGDVRLEWNPGDPDSLRAEMSLSAVRGRLGADDYTASTVASIDGRRLSLRSARLHFAGITADVRDLALSLEDGTLDGLAELSGNLAGRPVGGSLSVGAVFDPADSWAGIGGALEGFSGRIAVDSFRHETGGEWRDFGFDFSRRDGSVAVSGGPRGMLRFRMDGDGNLLLALSGPFPVRGSVIGSIRDGEIYARCNDLFVDMAGLLKMIPENEDFFVGDGYVTASVDIRGPLQDPEFYGLARGTGLRVNVPGFVSGEIRPVPFTAVVDGDEIRFGPISAAVGRGEGRVTGVFAFERWIPDAFSLDIDVPRASPIPFAMNLTGFSARGDASGFLNISRDSGVMSYSGDLWASHTVMGVDTDEIASGGEPFSGDSKPFTVDMTVTSGSAVEFFFPSAQFPIVRASPEMGTVVTISANSAERRYSVNSEVGIRGGEIFYFQRNFYIRSGVLVLRESEAGFDPRLTARAEIRDRSADGPVTLSMVVDNEPVASFEPRFESSPPRSQVEILTMLGQGVSGDLDAEDADPAMAFARSGADMLSQLTVVRTAERYIRNLTGLDMFSVRTQAISNMVISAVEGPDRQVDTNRRFGNYFDNTTIFGGRYLGQDMFVQGMLSISQDAVGGGLTMKPDIGFDLQGPMINRYRLRIRWDFSPASAENWLFVSDNSVTLTFSRLF